MDETVPVVAEQPENTPGVGPLKIEAFRPLLTGISDQRARLLVSDLLVALGSQGDDTTFEPLNHLSEADKAKLKDLAFKMRSSAASDWADKNPPSPEVS